MGLLTILGVSLLAETIGGKIQEIAQDAHEASYEKARLKADMNEQIARMQENTARENAYLRAEIARMQEETNRVNARVYAEAGVERQRLRTVGDLAKSFIESGKIFNRDNSNTSDTLQSGINRWITGNAGRSNYIETVENQQTSYAIEPQFCHVCGRKLVNGASFCSGCGTKIRY